MTAQLYSSIRWRKSSASGSGTTNCVELATPDDRTFLVRDSKNPGPRLAFTSPDWVAFLRQFHR